MVIATHTNRAITYVIFAATMFAAGAFYLSRNNSDSGLVRVGAAESVVPPALNCPAGEGFTVVHSDASEGADLSPTHRAAFEGELRQDYPGILPGAFRLAYENEVEARYEFGLDGAVQAYSIVAFMRHGEKSGWAHKHSELCASTANAGVRSSSP